MGMGSGRRVDSTQMVAVDGPNPHRRLIDILPNLVNWEI